MDEWDRKVDEAIEWADEFKKLLLKVVREKHARWCPVRMDVAADCRCGIDNDGADPDS